MRKIYEEYGVTIAGLLAAAVLVIYAKSISPPDQVRDLWYDVVKPMMEHTK
jgi:hypothetical protein